MRDRLIELIKEVIEEWESYYVYSLSKGEPRSKTYDGFIADHLIANGVIVPPVAIGQTVYEIAPYETIPLGEIKSKRVVGFEQYEHLIYVCCLGTKYPISNFGKTVFLTREDAERALEEMQNNGGS